MATTLDIEDLGTVHAFLDKVAEACRTTGVTIGSAIVCLPDGEYVGMLDVRSDGSPELRIGE